MANINITCPACNYRFDMLSGLQDAQQRKYWEMLVKAKLDTQRIGLLMRYMAMFKPAQYAMSFNVLFTRTSSLFELIKTGTVTRNRDLRSAPSDLWWKTIDQLVNNKPESLQLPLKAHAYLEQMVWGSGDKAAAAKEAKQIEQQQNRERHHEQGLQNWGELKQSLANPSTPSERKNEETS